MFGKKQVAALGAEFIGTAAITLMILSIQRSNIGVAFFVAAGAAVAVAAATFILIDNSGGHFNPAITLALWTARKISTIRGVLYIIAQFLGAWAAFGLYTYLINTHLQSVGGTYHARILVAEAVGTAVFSFGFAATVYKKSNNASSAAFRGLAYMLGAIIASPAALGLLNPAVALGAKAWVWTTYVLGPVLGALVGVNLFGLLFADSNSTKSAAVVSTSTTSSTAKKPAAKKKSSKK
jgi:aquaporin Z